MRVIYESRHRPVLLSAPVGLHDEQGEIPRGWCQRCGSEVFESGSVLCADCRNEEESENEQELQ